MRRTFGVLAGAAMVAMAAVVVMAPAGAATTSTIALFAGNGAQGFTGNGGAATAAEFYHPSDEAVSSSGTVYIADMKNCQVRQVVNGVISAFAGVGTCATGGNAGLNPLGGLGGAATSATIGMPTGVAVDSSNNVYIADCTDYTGTGPGCTQGYILKVSGGTISALVTPAQIGSPWTSDGNGGVAAPWGVRTSGSNVYFSDVVDNVVDEVANTGGTPADVAGNGTTGYAGNGGAATAAALDDPTGVYVDASGNLFIADSKNAVIRKVTGGVISTFAGDGTAGYSGNGGQADVAELAKPFGVTEDSSGNVYIADYNAYCVRAVSTSGIISTYAGTCGDSGTTVEGGSPSSALLVGPSQVVFDSSGNLYINDYEGEQIDKVTTVVTTTAAPVVTTQPVSQTYTNGQSLTFTAAASGTPAPTVQWQVSTNHGSTWANLSGATSDSFTAASLNPYVSGWEVRAVFTNSVGTATSNAATLTFVAAPVVTTQPVSQTYTNGQSLTFTAAASGTPAPTVQWQVSTNHGSTWANVSGATSDSFTAASLNPYVSGWEVRAVFTNSVSTATSNAATLTYT